MRWSSTHVHGAPINFAGVVHIEFLKGIKKSLVLTQCKALTFLQRVHDFEELLAERALEEPCKRVC